MPKDLKNFAFITKKQINAYYATKKHVNSFKKVLKEILERSKEAGHFQDFLDINLKIKNEKVKHYLKEARKCYAVKSYDATIVMLARVVEYVLKDFLRQNNIQFNVKTLGKLISLYESNFKDKKHRRVLGKINIRST